MAEFIRYKNQNEGSLRWITISTLLLAIGVILRMISPNVGGITLNWGIVMYTTAIMLCRPSVSQGFGIGVVAGIVATMTSKAAFPYANLVSDPVAAFVCALLAKNYILDFKIKKISLEPALLVFITTVISGGLFITITKLVLNLPMNLYLYVLVPVVFTVGVLGMTAGQILYWPAKRIFYNEKQALEKFVLKNISLDIPKGSFTVLTGTSGAGKTTLLLSAAGARLAYFDGFENSSYKINGIDIVNSEIDDLNNLVGVVMADYEAQLVTETVGDEIAFSLENKGVAREDIIAKRKEVLELVGLTGFEERTVASLSGGQKQRLAIAAILAIDPDVLVLDEPVAAIDPEGARDIYRLLKEINVKKEKTVIVAEHDLKYIDEYADSLMIMDKGEVKFIGSIKDTLRYMYDRKLYEEAVPLKWKIYMYIGEKTC